MMGGEVSEADSALFRAAVANIRPRGGGFDEVQSRIGKVRGRRKLGGGVQKTLLRKLKRGEIRPADKLDLHGHTATEAAAMLADFIGEAAAADERCVLVIHGKGLRSEVPGGVLKDFTADWLKRAPEVLAFAPARPKDGGTGAVYVLLRG